MAKLTINLDTPGMRAAIDKALAHIEAQYERAMVEPRYVTYQSLTDGVKRMRCDEPTLRRLQDFAKGDDSTATGTWDSSVDRAIDRMFGTEEAAVDPAQAERDRILSKLEALKPMEQPYTRRDWAIEQKGEKAMWERMVKAIREA